MKLDQLDCSPLVVSSLLTLELAPSAAAAAPRPTQMENIRLSSPNAQQQLRSFMSLPADDEMAQLILEELSFSRRSFTGVAAEIANSPSSMSATGLNSICEDEEED
ncbi:hypothetical protein P3T76_013621 [Phytophthora citrophthora]|uniref:Uncharacterized protein n=1 Tax=Phytophthora citrophthora TaxID=4793 RepID=A0AAD9G403_9STRA|nr:hypothetical protein P3T76_013621 [Phytophthora citrophthora]